MPSFLESGHSHMESDSMQSAIERQKRQADVFTMLDWVQISRQARRKNSCKVINYHHEDLYNFLELAQTLLTNKRRITDGNMVKWLSVKNFKNDS